MVTLDVRPAGKGRFDVSYKGKYLLASNQPLLDGARALLKQGLDPNTPLTMKHEDASHVSFEPLPIGTLAKWSINPNRLVPYRWTPYGEK